MSRSHSPVALFDALEPGYDEAPADDDDRARVPGARVRGRRRRQARKGRSSMPSWDEIVFGARTDD